MVAQPSEAGAGSRQRWTLILGSLASFMVGLDALIVTTALPTFQETFHSSTDGLSWTINAFTLAFATTILTGATLGERFGRRLVFVLGLALFCLGSAACALSSSMGMLIAARVFQGVGGGIAVPLTLALITAATPPRERGRALGIWGACTGVAVAAAPLIGGILIQRLSWHWIFWINVPLGAVVIIMALRRIEPSQGEGRSVDIGGLILSTAGVFGVVEALVRGQSVGWTSVTVLIGLIGGVLALTAFVAYQARVREPMMPMRLFRNRSFTGGCIAFFVLWIGLYGPAFLMSQYLQLALHNDPLGVGIRFLPWTGLTILVSPLAGRLSDRIGDVALVITGLLLQAAAFLALGFLVASTTGYGTVVVPLILAGIGVGTAFPTVTSALMRSVSPLDAGVASGVGNTFRQVGGVFGVAIATVLFSANGSYGGRAHFVSGLAPSLIGLGAIGIVGTAVTAIMIRGSVPSVIPPVGAVSATAGQKTGS